MNCLRHLTSSNPIAVLSATSKTHPSPSSTEQLVDTSTRATLSFPNDVTGTLYCDLAKPWWGPFGLIPPMPDIGIMVECEGGDVELFNFPGPVFYHSITVRRKDAQGRITKRVEKAYKCDDGRNEEDWWTTYRHQLDAFVDGVKGRTPKTWVSQQDSVDNMEWIEKVYEKVSPPCQVSISCVVTVSCISQTGLGSRPQSQYVYSE